MEDYQRYIIYDHVTYDKEDASQMSSLQTIQSYMNNNMICTEYQANGNYREYKASTMTSIPTHPIRTDYGYENLKTGSVIYAIDSATVYMYDEFTDAWVEQ